MNVFSTFKLLHRLKQPVAPLTGQSEVAVMNCSCLVAVLLDKGQVREMTAKVGDFFLFCCHYSLEFLDFNLIIAIKVNRILYFDFQMCKLLWILVLSVFLMADKSLAYQAVSDPLR